MPRLGGGSGGRGGLHWTITAVSEQAGRTRREILKSAIGTAAGIVLAGPVRRVGASTAQAVPEPSGTMRLADDLFLMRLPGQTNVVAHTGADGVVLVDGVLADSSDALMKAIAGLPGAGPVRTIFNTHWHPEQTG